MLQINQLQMSNFRAWSQVKLNLHPGLTLLIGNNGTGKSSLIMGVQYALAGGVSGFHLKDLLKQGASSFKVALGCRYNDDSIVIHRGKRLNKIVFNDTEEINVRDRNYTDILKRTAESCMITGTVASFVDMMPHERKKYLTNTISEATMLRGPATEIVVSAAEEMATKKIEAIHNYEVAVVRLTEAQDVLAELKKHYVEEEERLKSIREQTAYTLPFSEANYKKKCNEREENATKIVTTNKEITNIKTFIHKVELVEKMIADRESKTVALKQRLDSYDNDIEQLRMTLKELMQPLSCPVCGEGVVCTCGSPVNTNINALDRTRKAIKNKLEAREVDLINYNVYMKEIKEYSARIPSNMDEGRAKLVLLEGNVESYKALNDTLTNDINTFDRVKQQIEAIKKVTSSSVTLDKIKDRIRAQKEKITNLEQVSMRKQHIINIIDDKTDLFRRIKTIVYNSLPGIYFSNKLSKVNNLVNTLSRKLGGMEINLSDGEQGIDITANGKLYKMLSSGEKQRVRIATTLGFGLLNPLSDTLFIDEVFDSGLDTEGAELLASMLKTDMLAFYKKIVMVSHKSELVLSLAPDNVIEVQNNAGIHALHKVSISGGVLSSEN